ncbi:MAG: 3-deoxy-7-phosphoheptulonate synthase, partial [Myxococcota bacterium]
CGSELLDPMMPHFIGDLLGWGAVGARTSPSQTHREMASGLAMPVGFKNGTDGDIDVAVNAAIAAASPHTFPGISRDGSPAQIRTRGNAEGHIILRGGTKGPNFARERVARAADALGMPQPARRIMVDCSHGNSNKDHRLQGFVCREVLRQVRTLGHPIMGLMLESNLLAGRQTWTPGVTPRRGVSITDACIGWDETEDLLNEIAEAVRLGP